MKGLQDDLLTSLSESRTNLLENDELVSTLEHLQHEGSRISHEMDEAKRVMDRMDAAADMFLPLAVACSRIFFCIERLPELHPSYEFSLTFYFSLVDETLDSMKKHVSIDASASEKARALMQEIFAVTYQKISRGLLQQDHLSFGVRLAQLRLLSEDASDIDSSLFDSLLKVFNLFINLYHDFDFVILIVLLCIISFTHHHCIDFYLCRIGFWNFTCKFTNERYWIG